MGGKRWTDQELEDLRVMFTNPAISQEELEQHFGRSFSIITLMARRLRLRRYGLRPWTAEEEQLLRELYPDLNNSREEIASHLGRTWRAIQHKIYELGIGETRERNNPCHVRRDYFKVIDSEEKAYWLGFIAADGCVYIGGRQHTLRIDLQPRDLHWLERFRDIIAPGMQITKHGERSYSFGIGSQELVSDLITLGITPRKSLTLEWPNVPELFEIPFLLGYFDGDGSLTRRPSQKGEKYQWQLVGTLPFLERARASLRYHAGVELQPPIRADKNASPHLYLLYAASQSIAIDRALNASGLGLPRKHIAATQTAP